MAVLSSDKSAAPLGKELLLTDEIFSKYIKVFF